ncbi:response regulator [Pararhizobium sp. DWP3-4]|uniref:response regulator n=1 Tax=Pararhizobium sp. DWP3-4 TaxID=2804565 RepID=UPI003CED598B
MKFLLVEDDPLVAKSIRRDWPTPSDHIDVITTFAQCARIIASEQIDEYDALIVDMNLPDGNAVQVLSQLRLRSELPAIIISGSGSPEVRASTLDIGADDYVMKPFSMRELQARVSRAVIRMRGQETTDRIFDFGNFQYFPKTKSLKTPNGHLALTNMEGRLMFQLVTSTGKVCSRRQLSETVCFRPFRSDDKTIDIYIGRLRTAFSKFMDEEVIETVRGAGYRFLLKPVV